MTAFVVHDHASLMASAAPGHPIKVRLSVHNTMGKLILMHEHKNMNGL